MVGDYSKVVPPGQEGKVELLIHDTRNFTGAVTKSARVSTNDPKRRSFSLVIRARFASDLTPPGPPAPAMGL